MPFDAHRNLAIATVTTATGAAGTTLGVGAGEGARFPAVPFNATVWPFDMAPDPTTAEVVRVTARAGDSLTITRAQEGTTARAIVVGDLVAATITAKSLTDIESGVNFPLVSVAPVVLETEGVRVNTVDGADNRTLYLTGGGAIVSPARGAYLALHGNEVPVTGGHVRLTAGAVGTITFDTGGGFNRGVMHTSGGFSWGGTTDPGAGNVSLANLHLSGGGPHSIACNTPPGADTGYVNLCSGAAADANRGANLTVHGNNVAGAGGVAQVMAGDVATGTIDFYTGPTALRGKIHRSGGFSWGGTTDPGAGNISIGGDAGSVPVLGIVFNGILRNGIVLNDTSDSAGVGFSRFKAAGIEVGAIERSGAGTIYKTTSDARLKTPLSRHTDPSVLRDTVIHNFIWKSDGTAGRGVFAQEAHTVAPFAVSVGGDEVDAEGRLTHPWGVDYSKYVPDLITGWQSHETSLNDIRGEVALLRASVGLLKRGNPQPVISDSPAYRIRDYLRSVIAWIGRMPSWI